MKGKIIKGIAGFYYIYAENGELYECKAKGIFRKEGRKPLVGDDVLMDVLDEKEKEGNVVSLLPRRNELVRPAVANVDQAVLIFAMHEPEPNFLLLDRYLSMMAFQKVPAVLCFSKCDLAKEQEIMEVQERYRQAGFKVTVCSAACGEGLGEFRSLLEGRTSVIAGPSGVGKSTLTNSMQSGVLMETGAISRKLGRGKHTTRHSQVIPVGKNTFLVDTPGFTSLFLPQMKEQDLEQTFPEFAPYREECRFAGCRHDKEPDCEVKKALSLGKINPERYANYLELLGEVRAMKPY